MSRVMIVDDDEDFATAAATVLKSLGHDVGVHLEARGALEVLEKAKPDLVILDVMFPEDSAAGFEIARGIRERRDTIGSVPVLLLTAVNAKFPLGFGAKDLSNDFLPADDFLEKPVDMTVLCQRASALLAK